MGFLSIRCWHEGACHGPSDIDEHTNIHAIFFVSMESEKQVGLLADGF